MTQIIVRSLSESHLYEGMNNFLRTRAKILNGARNVPSSPRKGTSAVSTRIFQMLKSLL